MDLRKRIADAYLECDGTNGEIAARFGVSIPTVERLGRRVREGTGLVPLPRPGRPRLLNERHHKWIVSELTRDPYITSYELTRRFRTRHRSVDIHRSTILRAMRDVGYSFKKRLRTHLSVIDVTSSKSALRSQ